MYDGMAVTLRFCIFPVSCFLLLKSTGQLQYVNDAAPSPDPQLLCDNAKQIKVSHALLNWAELLGGNTVLIYLGNGFIYDLKESNFFTKSFESI